MKKKCFKCERVLPLSQFYKHKQMSDGHLNKCKKCTKSDAKANRDKNIEYYRAYDRERGNRQSPEYHVEYRKQFPKKYKAKNAVGNAIRDGRMKKEDTCSKCGSEFSVHAHHDDYDYPLTVRWLCAACHHQWHAKHGEAKNAR